MYKSVIIIFFLMMTIFCSAQKCDTAALHILENKLGVIEGYVTGKKGDPEMKRSGIIYFFEMLTGIQSTSTGTYFGKLNPSAEDVKKWKKWVLDNKYLVLLDQKKKAILFKTNVVTIPD
jgi:hypothetical protein